jgi:hypothetical protein
MKKFLSLILLLGSFMAADAQTSNQVVIDYGGTLQIKQKKVDPQKPLTILLKNCSKVVSLSFKAELVYKGGDLPSVKLDCDKDSKVIDLKATFKNDQTNSLTVTINADKTTTGDKGASFSFVIKPSGEIAAAKSEDTEKPEKKPLPEFVTDFVPASVYDTQLPATNAECRYPIIYYDPCCNCTKVISGLDENKKEVNTKYLKYHSNVSKNNGVVFLIRNFNTLLYDISVSNDFESSNTEAPELFNTVYKLIGTVGGAQSQADNELQTELSKLVKLNADLKRFLAKKMTDDGCSVTSQGYEKEKLAIATIIQKEYNLKTSLLKIDEKYESLKSKVIKQNTKPDKAYTTADFNKDLQETYSLPVTPDSIMRETKKVLNIIMTTKFEFQYNIPQLQNADQLNFTLNITPKTGTNGSIRVIKQPLSFPIRGGVKIDFSSGLYYSSISNEKYNLRDKIVGDTVQSKEIVDQHFARNGKSTVGIMALMHIYPRLGSVQPAFTFGFGKSLDLNYSVLIGGSLMFGKGNRFGISGGFNFSSVQALAGKYYDDKGILIKSQPKSITSLDSYNKIRRGGFIGFSYSLWGGTKKTQEASSSGSTTAAEPAKKAEGEAEKAK